MASANEPRPQTIDFFHTNSNQWYPNSHHCWWWMLINWAVFLNVNMQCNTYAETLHTPIYRCRLHKLFCNNRVFSLCQYQTEKNCNWPDYFYTRAHVYCTSSWHTVCGPMGPTAYKNVDSGRYFWPSAPKRGHVWVTDAVVRGCARDVPGMWRESGREGGRDRERWLTRGPSILRVTVEVHSVRLVSLMCITLAWRVMEGGRLSRGAREWLILHILEEEQERRYPCAWLMA